MTAAENAEWLDMLKTGLHANEAETSAVLAINPNLVDMEHANAEMPNFPAFKVNPGAVHAAFFFSQPGSVHRATQSGTWGDARQSTAEKGERFLEAGARSTIACLENIEEAFANMPPRN
jgi:creatinine amidohydrolase